MAGKKRVQQQRERDVQRLAEREVGYAVGKKYKASSNRVIVKSYSVDKDGKFVVGVKGSYSSEQYSSLSSYWTTRLTS